MKFTTYGKKSSTQMVAAIGRSRVAEICTNYSAGNFLKPTCIIGVFIYSHTSSFILVNHIRINNT
jgi:hypothetical protein